MSTPIKISSSKYEMPSPASWMSPASKKSSPASKMSSPAPKMSSLASKMSAPAGEMSSPASQMTAPKSRAASMDSKCTTFSDIIRALDETHDRIASMGVDEIKQDRMDSLYSLLDDGQPKTPARRAFDQKKYLADYKNGDITLRQIQVAANATKTPEEHRADWIRVNGKLPEPKCGYGKCTYDPYPLPAKRRRDAISDNIEDAVKAVKNVFK
ncbi:hypothetical protein E4T52_15963 [Aureobasidium sp. EXF-3400]|nr:hypothetical protein E4T51_10324 [Aureobasidium sp. EXF-12344]KAI4768971.1 hypothetical protein E4T52_15963 [Aureobasidium sp. EXF-3400]